MYLRSGAGLDIAVDLDHGMDLRNAAFRGVPVELALPSDESPDADWLGRWAGGLLTTCGLRNVGPAGDVDGEGFDQHGRASSLKADNVEAVGDWDGDCFTSRVTGTMHEPTREGEHLEWRRTWQMTAGENRLELEDVVVNCGVRHEVVLLLYHVNPGWPLVDTGAVIQVGERIERIAEPSDDGPERVEPLSVAPDDDGWCRARLSGHDTRFTLAWDSGRLPCFTLWQWPVRGWYAVSFEPATCLPYGRADELAAGRGHVLAPDEEFRTRLVFEFEPLEDDITERDP